MSDVTVYLVDAFTDEPFRGNPAGVVPDAFALCKEQMQDIARELNMSETAFLLPGGDDFDARIRYFTPTSEIDFCGHATLATAWLLLTEISTRKCESGVKFLTNIGIVPVVPNYSRHGEVESVYMQQVAPQVRDVLEGNDVIARAVGIKVSDLDTDYPIRLAYTGNWHLLVPVKTREAIDSATPQLEELRDLNVLQNAVTTHLFTTACTGQPYHIYTRDFGPAVGIVEDPVTGSANGALAGYLVLEGKLEDNQTHRLKIAQGDVIGRAGRVSVEVQPGDKPIIRVGGRAVVTMQGKLIL